MLRNMTAARRSQLLHWLRTERAPWIHDRVPTAQACRVAVASYLTTSMSFLTSIPGFNDNEMTMSPAIFSAAVAWGLDVAKIYVSPGVEGASSSSTSTPRTAAVSRTGPSSDTTSPPRTWPSWPTTRACSTR